MSAKLKLYGFKASPPVRAVILTLRALDLDFEFIEVNTLAKEQLSPDYIKKNPQHTVPTLEDDGHYMWDSHAISAYLVRKYGKDDSLYPKDFYLRAVVDQRLHYETGILFETHLRGIVGGLVGGTLTKATYAEKVKGVSESYDMLETFLGDNPYIAGKQLTIADLSIVTSLLSLTMSVPLIGHPKLAAWHEKIQKLPYYEQPDTAGVQEFTKVILAKLAELK